MEYRHSGPSKMPGCNHRALKKKRLLYGAVTAFGRLIALLDDVMINPLRHQTPRLIQGRFRMMDAIKSRAGIERGDIVCPHLLKLLISRDHSPFAVSRYPAAIDHCVYP